MAAKSSDEISFLGQLGMRVRRARSRAGITRRKLANDSGVSERYLAQLESGDGNISILLIRRVAAALGADVHELIGEPFELDRRERIALVGMRGAGKSTLGARLAEYLEVPFFELGAEIERDLGASLASLFAQKGQDSLREAERRVLARLVDTHQRCVIATGGSLVLEPQAYQLLRSRCFTVWLKATPEDHIGRIVAQGDMRPLQGHDHPLVELRAILAQRERLYALADLAVDTSELDEDSCLALLVEAIGRPTEGRLPPASEQPSEIT